MIFDSHAHLNFQVFGEDLNEVISRCVEKRMLVLNVGSQYETSKKALEIAENNSGFFASVGIHPIHVWGDNLDPIEMAVNNEISKRDLNDIFLKISELAKNLKVVAIGETGLDYFRISENKKEAIALQKEYFIKHLHLASELNKALILHARTGDGNDAYDDILDILKDENPLPFSNKKGVIHCFGSNVETANKFINLGFAIGFTGIITFEKKSEEIQEIVKQIPLENILIETDSPYLTPVPFRGKRNEPINVEFVAKKIAELKGIDIEKVIEQTTKNAIEIFKITI